MVQLDHLRTRCGVLKNGQFPVALRKALRKHDVLAATALANATLYLKIGQGKFPKGTKLDPNGRAVIWWEDEIEAFQRGEWSPDWKPASELREVA